MKKIVPQPKTKGIAIVPVIMQMEALECGAACLAMVMAYYRKWVPLEVLRTDCGVSRDGSKALNIVKAARSYGFEAGGFKAEPEDLRKGGTFPCIIHWGFNHFVVCNGFRGDKAFINDPARGFYTVSMETFDEKFTGVCLIMTPTEQFQPSGSRPNVLRFALDRLRSARGALWFMTIISVITALVGIITAALSRFFMDEMLPGKEPDMFWPFIIAMSSVALVQLAVAWMRAIYSLRLNGKMDVVGSSTYMWKVFHLPMEFFSQRMAGDIQQRKNTNASIAGQVVDIVAPMFLNAIMMVFYLVVMLRYSLLLTIVGIGSVLVQFILSRIIAKRRVAINNVMMRDAGKLTGYTLSGMEMIENIKASGAENGYFERWAGYQASVNTQNVYYRKVQYYVGMLPGLASEVLNILITVLGVWLVMRGEFTPGMVFAFQGFLSAFLGPATSLITSGKDILEMRTNMERIEDVMNYPDDESVTFEEEPLVDGKLDKLSGKLSIRNLTFGYSKLDKPLITDFNLELEQGKSVALVGASGCGKSTISKLVANLYQPWGGEILFDGKPASEINRFVFKESVGVVDQDVIIFEDSVAANIKMWDASIEDVVMTNAAKEAQVHSTIMRREGAYRHKMSEGGKDFSGGERQRIEIARVLSRNPKLLILDEATSALDARTEYDVVNSIRNKGITTIVIAHRLSTVRDCDEIIVLDHGKVVERGTHDELMARNGAYSELISNE